MVRQPRATSLGDRNRLVKPFHYPELLARIGAVRKRLERARRGNELRHLDLVVNTLAREVTLGGARIDLSAKEFALLATLASEPHRVFAKRDLLRIVWDFRSSAKTRTLDSHASRLRQKLSAAGDDGWIGNVWGVGYRLRRPE